MSVPATIGNQLIDEINRLGRLAEVTEMDFKRLLRSIEPLKSKEPDNAYMLAGMAHALTWNANGIRLNFDNALRLNPGHSVILNNYAVSLSRICYEDESRDLYLKSLQCATREYTMQEYINKCTATNRIDLCKRGLDLYVARGGTMTSNLEEAVEQAEGVGSLLKLVGLEYETAAALYAVVGEIQRQFKIPDSGSKLWLSAEDGMKYLSGFIEVAREIPADTIAEMNEALSIAVVEQFEMEESDKLVYQFVPRRHASAERLVPKEQSMAKGLR